MDKVMIASVDKGIHDKKQNNGLPTYDNTAQVETMGGVVM